MKKFKINLLSGISITFGIMLLVILGSFVLAFLDQKQYVDFTVWKICMIAGGVLFLLGAFFFWKCVFLPVLKLQSALEKLDAINSGTPMNLWASADSMADSINALLEELKLSLEREHAEVMLRQQSKYAELQNQINPHFLYNTLETIRGQAIIDDNYKIADMTEALSRYFRYNISKDNDFVTVAQELENIRNYIHIQQYRFQDRFVFRIYSRVPTNEYTDCLLPKMTLQPIVENAIFHGMEQKVEPGHISIHIEATQERLIIIVADDGVGMDPDMLEKLNRKLMDAEDIVELSKKSGHNGIAMENVNSRLRYLYGKDCGLRISSTRDMGTEVEITLPKIKVGEKQEHL